MLSRPFCVRLEDSRFGDRLDERVWYEDRWVCRVEGFNSIQGMVCYLGLFLEKGPLYDLFGSL